MKSRVIYEGEQAVDLEHDSYTVCYTVVADCYYQPAKLGGPPENCYPEESEYDEISFKIDLIISSSGEHVNLKELEVKCLANLDAEQIEEKVWQSFMESRGS